MNQNHKTILLVEDNRDDEELILMAFNDNDLDCEIVIVRDGAEALDYLFGSGPYSGRNISIQPSVTLMDLKLPKINGLQALSYLRADPRTRSIPVVMLTSSSQEEDLLTSYKLGVNSYIRKPVQYDQFVKVIGSLGLYWTVWNVTPPGPHSGN